ncbi:hypothetical protein [Mycolicibacterium mageritense]|uniref:hypothetical protein n=1 Tax=Mycolicibacterium mageritense TaxID=53462 RepID=UPI0011D935C9|nr:hypothetical protein [Mycolicibacterium mageritense]TXI56471.1 MAG: hypothetical protein E6Q55_28815 [Mycolicibacterium mageritense]
MSTHPTIDLRQMTMSSSGFHDTSTGLTFRDVDNANKEIRALAIANSHAADIVIERDNNSPIDRALRVTIHWGLSTDLYHLGTVDHAPPADH